MGIGTFSGLVRQSSIRLQSYLRVSPTFSGGERSMSLFKAWGAAKPHEHSFTRSQRGDTYDPCALAVSDGLKARVARDQIEINMKTGAMPQGCGSSMYSRQMKMEFPQAPEPIIGMSDLRAQKGH